MNRFLLAVACFGVIGLPVFGQSSRPRVAATPTPKAPTIKNDNQTQTDQRGAPVLVGDKSRQQTETKSKATDIKDEDDVIRVETNLVTMPVSVLDRDGRFISGLQQRDFKIFENGVEQKVDYFQSVEQPFTVVLMIDVSPSTRYQIDQIHEAAITFVNQLRQNDRVMVVTFDDKIHVLTYPTSDRYQLRRAILTAEFGDGTSLYEAVDHVLNRELNRIEGRKAIVLFTDGVDTTSRHAGFESTLQDAEETDVLIYPIRYDTQQDGFGGWGGGSQSRRGGRNSGGGIFDVLLGTIFGGVIQNMPQGGNGGGRNVYEMGQRYLEQLAQNSGGRKFEADTLFNLEASFSGIAEELRRQYSLGYYPENIGQVGDRKQISIRVMRPNVVVRAKNSYIVGRGSGQVAGT
ncbi:MAG: VWA domain-containing protein [Pyrinomonadaceae bacterium]